MLNRRLRDLRRIASRLKRSRMTPLQVCEAIIEKRLVDREARTFFSGLPDMFAAVRDGRGRCVSRMHGGGTRPANAADSLGARWLLRPMRRPAQRDSLPRWARTGRETIHSMNRNRD